MAQTATRRIVGIECPKCGSATRVADTTNYVSWIQRTRVCTNHRCRYAFDTAERKISPDDHRSAVKPDLFD